MSVLERARMPIMRPLVVQCEVCACDVAVHPKGMVPRYCADCRVQAYKDAQNRRPRHKPTDEGYDLALKVTNQRLAIEQAKSLLKMALLRPARCLELADRALDHLEACDGWANYKRDDVITLPEREGVSDGHR